MATFLLIFIVIVQKCLSLDEIESCKKSFNITTVSQNILCDQFLITSLEDLLETARKLNKYLQHKIDIFNDHKSEVCGIPDENVVNKNCPQRVIYSSCKDAVTKHGPGVYLIDPDYIDMKPIMMYCELSLDGDLPWVVIQRRINDSVSFDRSWDTYVNGFGGPYVSYWMGLEKIHALTTNNDFELWIEITSKHNIVKNANYNHFGLGSKAKNYNLLFLGDCTGDAGDGLRANVGFAFSTKDSQNENLTGFKNIDSGWWHEKENCLCNLNSDYTKTTWSTWMDKDNGFLKVQMAIREKEKPRSCA